MCIHWCVNNGTFHLELRQLVLFDHIMPYQLAKVITALDRLLYTPLIRKHATCTGQ